MSFENTKDDLTAPTNVVEPARPFLNWNWCWTGVGAIACLITNVILGLKKHPVPTTRPKFIGHIQPFNGGIHKSLELDVTSVVAINPPLNYAPLVQPIKHVIDLEDDINNTDVDHYVDVDYIRHVSVVADLCSKHIQHAMQDGVIPPIDQLSESDKTIFHEIDHVATQLLPLATRTIHIPTVLLAAKELTPMLETSIRHFKCTTTVRLSRSELNYFFGVTMLPKVLLHLTANTKFKVTNENLSYTACEVLYNFFDATNRVQPLYHLIDHYSIEDYDQIALIMKNQCIYKDWNNRKWLLTGRFIEEKLSLLNPCLFQFPTPGLNGTESN